MTVTRWRMVVEYDGAPFVGFQRQVNGSTVQAALEDAIRACAGEAVTVHGAGRTDSGVHARAMTVHFDLAGGRFASGLRLRAALNARLEPKPVSVLSVARAAPDFHARFSARGRVYLYRILDRHPPPALARGRVWHVPQRLDVPAMRDAAARLEGHHDFTSFRAAGCQARSPLRTLDQLRVTRDGEEVRVTAAARAFLHSQVRIIAGTLVQAGLGRVEPTAMADMLAARDRAAAGPTAPPHGLCFMEAIYDG